MSADVLREALMRGEGSAPPFPIQWFEASNGMDYRLVVFLLLGLTLITTLSSRNLLSCWAEVQNSLVGLWRSHYCHLPFVYVAIIHQPSWKAVNRSSEQFCTVRTSSVICQCELDTTVDRLTTESLPLSCFFSSRAPWSAIYLWKRPYRLSRWVFLNRWPPRARKQADKRGSRQLIKFRAASTQRDVRERFRSYD